MNVFKNGLEISNVVYATYSKLNGMILRNETDTDGYYKLLDELEEYIATERKIYSELDAEDAKMFLDFIADEDEFLINNGRYRYYIRLRGRIDENEDKNYYFTKRTMMAMILTETLKKVKETILSTGYDDDAEYTLSQDLFDVFQCDKLEVIMNEEVLEQMALQYDFEIDDFPEISIDQIKKEFVTNKKCSSVLSTLPLDLAMDAIDEFKDLECDSVDNIYTSLFFICQLDVIMSILGKNKNNEIIDYYMKCGNKNKFTDGYARRLFKKVKETKN